MRCLSLLLVLLLSSQASCKNCSSTEAAAADASTSQPLPEGVPFHDVVSLTAGLYETCVVVASGAAYCAGGAREAYHPEQSLARPIPGLEHTTQLSIGESACAVQESGNVLCWGESRNEVMPQKDPGKRFDPVVIPGLPPASLVLATEAAFPYWAFARDAGPAWHWGGTTFDEAFVAPANEKGLVLADPVQVQASNNFNCARLRAGHVSCWDWQGNADEALKLSVKALPEFRPAKVIDIAVSYPDLSAPQVACVLDGEGHAVCWRYAGEALTTPESFAHPFVGGRRWKDIAMAARHSCGVDHDGSVWCTGRNRYGELGVTEPRTSESLIQVPGVVGAKAVAVGFDHSCALLENASVKCWGSNDSGQCGVPGRAKQVAPTTFLRFTGQSAAP